MNILFVCTGNTCRSPMCEAYFRALCIRKGNNAFSCASAGLSAYPGEKMSVNAAEVLKKEKINPAQHRSRQLSKEIADKADLIIALTSAHRRAVLGNYSLPEEKVRLLGGFTDPDFPRDVADPYGGDQAVYQACFSEIRTHLDNLYEKLTLSIK